MSSSEVPAPEPTITCVDCGGTAHLTTTWPPDDPPRPGDLLTYRCADCADRWDLLVPDPDEDGEDDEDRGGDGDRAGPW